MTGKINQRVNMHYFSTEANLKWVLISIKFPRPENTIFHKGSIGRLFIKVKINRGH